METWGSSGDEITLLELNQFDSAENELNLMLDCASDAAVTTSTEIAIIVEKSPAPRTNAL